MKTKKHTSGSEVRNQRVNQGLSIEMLAEMSGIAHRTIQRIETGESNPRGYTLNRLAVALNCEITKFTKEISSLSKEEIQKLKWLNLSALLIIFLPLANLIVPVVLWTKNRTTTLVENIGARIINFQITWTVVTSIALIIAPFHLLFFEKSMVTPIGAVIFTYLAFYLYNIIQTLIQANHIHSKRWEKIYPRSPRLL